MSGRAAKIKVLGRVTQNTKCVEFNCLVRVTRRRVEVQSQRISVRIERTESARSSFAHEYVKMGVPSKCCIESPTSQSVMKSQCLRGCSETSLTWKYCRDIVPASAREDVQECREMVGELSKPGHVTKKCTSVFFF